jgi:hypothetical protein
MEIRAKKRRHISKFFVAVLLMGAVGGVGAYAWYGMPKNDKQTSNNHATEQAVAEAVPKSIVSKTAFFGTTFWGRYMNDWAMKSSLKYAYPFSRLGEFNRSSYDAWIAGLECPTVPGVTTSSADMDATLTFNCSSEYLKEAAKWFTAFSLANNHTDNQGADGFATTREQLEKVGVQYFGHYNPQVTNDLCEVVGLPARVTTSDGKTKKVDLPIALCGYHGVFQIPSDEAVAQISKYKDIMPVIAMPHMGAEYEPAPDQIRTTLYRQMIDAGADMVIADHPHWTQTSEAYKGKLIVYSMGNFMFDQQDTSEVTRSAGIGVTFTAKNVDEGQLQHWIDLGEKCKEFKDDCLADAGDEGLKKLPFKYDIEVIATNDSGKITHPATTDQRTSLLQRLKWAQTITGLKSPYHGM